MVVLDIRLAKKGKKKVKKRDIIILRQSMAFSSLDLSNCRLNLRKYLLKNTACQKMFPPCYCHPILMQIYGAKTSSETRGFQICASFFHVSAFL